MAITLARLFADSEKEYQIKLIAGHRGMKSLVRWVHMVEDSEVPGFLHGNELVFSTGIAQKGTNWLLDFVRNLRRHGAIGWVVNLGPYIAEVPQSVIAYCNDNHFPLFTIPWEMRLIDVTYDFTHRIVANEEHETGIATAFRNLIFSPENRDSYVQTLERRGFHNVGEYSLMLIRADRDRVRVLGDEWQRIKFAVQSALRNLEKPACIFVQVNDLVVIGSGITGTEMEAYARLLIKEVFAKWEDFHVYIGISDTVTGYGNMQSCYKQAVTAAKTAKLQNKSILKYQNAGIYKLIFAIEDPAVLKRFVEDDIRRIEEYDLKNQTDYLDTLKCYLTNNGSIQKVSEQKNVHRNTINHKMRFIRDAFQLKLDSEDIASLWLALAIREIID